jgi:hypothetical protein
MDEIEKMVRIALAEIKAPEDITEAFETFVGNERANTCSCPICTTAAITAVAGKVIHEEIGDRNTAELIFKLVSSVLLQLKIADVTLGKTIETFVCKREDVN